MTFHASFLVALLACLLGFWLPLALLVWRLVG